MRGMLVALIACGIAGACGKNSDPPPASTGQFGAKPESGPRGSATPGGDLPPGVEAREMFAQVCAQCHGADGTGNGPAAAAIQPKPRNYTDPAWQASVSDEDIEKIILLGGQAVGKSPMMPAQGQLKSRPEVVHDLVKIIRGFGPKK